MQVFILPSANYQNENLSQILSYSDFSKGSGLDWKDGDGIKEMELDGDEIGLELEEEEMNEEDGLEKDED